MQDSLVFSGLENKELIDYFYASIKSLNNAFEIDLD